MVKDWSSKQTKDIAEIIIDQFKLKDAKPVFTPDAEEEGTTAKDCDEELDEKQASQYRAIAARCNHITPDRFDIAQVAKEFAMKMSKPSKWGLAGTLTFRAISIGQTENATN